MGLLDSILGRSRPKQANLDALFAVPSAAITLRAAVGLAPTGLGAVCYRPAGGAAFALHPPHSRAAARAAGPDPGRAGQADSVSGRR